MFRRRSEGAAGAKRSSDGVEALPTDQFKRSRWVRVIGLGIGTVLGGCGNGTFLSDGGLSRPTLNLSTIGIGDETTHFEGLRNNALEEAELVELTDGPRIIRGSISGSDDVDVYDLGFMAKGTRVIVDMTADGTLDGALAIFDENGASLLVNDHRNVYLGQKAPFIDIVTRRDTENCYVAVAATPRFRANGDYALEARKIERTPVPASRPETVLLVFDGGSNVRIGGRAPVDVPVFDAGDIDARFSRATSAIMARIVGLVRADYAEHDVTILSTSEGATFDGTMTRLYFGTYDPGLLGVAEGVDEFNGTSEQKAIIFTDTFAAFSPLEPTIDEIGTALANVASHEIGHLLGLVHTKDAEGIMDVTASLNELMVDQSFRMSPLYSEVYPIGFQNAGQALLDAVGGTFDLTPFRNVGLPKMPAKLIDGADEPPAREQLLLSSCGLGGH